MREKRAKASGKGTAMKPSTMAKAATKKGKKKVSPKAKGASKLVEIDSGDESDGMTALKGVEERELKQGARRGPENESMKRFHDPVAVRDSRGNL
ncbi:uncharacterized protein LACBIDRAFT_307924 [Laccaria bicolor S238N-H82]|uniref:Predicted protein n=1 Tax=Laccaria bicolor (strain S238N-H82 / ATCC MYA-4686) TaxID=486041 RepID=B0DR80_LACBS|nr:uncharacterized protein LACBIDRAFT_307924 [Laccaria bicolor S238N-H82]EDR02825.1 predicted protein [Laccaria bicolor S238N-H82]|eukprot:XP_001886535.1 predicted protein [Laccaria bicolor S238N-H82]